MASTRLESIQFLFSDKISFGDKRYFGDPRYLARIRNKINNGGVQIEQQIVLKEEQRLDTLAGKYYGDARYWWIIAIASGIGYGLQVPPGTIITILNIGDILTEI